MWGDDKLTMKTLLGSAAILSATALSQVTISCHTVRTFNYQDRCAPTADWEEGSCGSTFQDPCPVQIILEEGSTEEDLEAQCGRRVLVDHAPFEVHGEIIGVVSRDDDITGRDLTMDYNIPRAALSDINFGSAICELPTKISAKVVNPYEPPEEKETTTKTADGASCVGVALAVCVAILGVLAL